jgi:hypothetical protein
MSVKSLAAMRLSGVVEPAVNSAFLERLQPVFHKAAIVSQEAASLVVAFLTPAAVAALVLGLWRLGTDLGWTDSFVISNGLFSHWQVWFALAVSIKVTGSYLARVMQPKPVEPQA